MKIHTCSSFCPALPFVFKISNRIEFDFKNQSINLPVLLRPPIFSWTVLYMCFLVSVGSVINILFKKAYQNLFI